MDETATGSRWPGDAGRPDGPVAVVGLGSVGTSLAAVLAEGGAEVRVTDPCVPSEEVEELLGVTPERLPETLSGADAVVVVADHDAYLALAPETLRERVGRDSFAVVDGRRVFAWDAFDGTDVTYRGVGRGVRE